VPQEGSLQVYWQEDRKKLKPVKPKTVEKKIGVERME
jgi:hypothetical protein